MDLLAVIALMVVFGVLGAVLAHKKGKTPSLWFVVCSLTCFFGLIFLLIIKGHGPLDKEQQQNV